MRHFLSGARRHDTNSGGATPSLACAAATKALQTGYQKKRARVIHTFKKVIRNKSARWQIFFHAWAKINHFIFRLTLGANEVYIEPVVKKKKPPAVVKKKKLTAADLKKFRQSLGLSQKQFAERLGFTREYVSFMENGKRPISSTVQKLCRLIAHESGESAT